MEGPPTIGQVALIILLLPAGCLAATVTAVDPLQDAHTPPASTNLTVVVDQVLDAGTVDSTSFRIHAEGYAPVTG